MRALAASLAIASLTATAAGCAAGEAVDANDGKLEVATTVAPITSIVASIGGDRVDVTGIVPEGTNSHTFEPKPSVAELLSTRRRRLHQRPEAGGPDRATWPRRT